MYEAPAGWSNFIDAYLSKAREVVAKRNEAIARHLLGRWVSGVEPVLYFDHLGRVIGIGTSAEMILSAD